MIRDFSSSIMDSYICPDCTAPEDACDNCPICDGDFEHLCSEFRKAIEAYAKEARKYHDTEASEAYWHDADDRGLW